MFFTCENLPVHWNLYLLFTLYHAIWLVNIVFLYYVFHLWKLISPLEFIKLYPPIRLIIIVFFILYASLAKTYYSTGVYKKKLRVGSYSQKSCAKCINYVWGSQKEKLGCTFFLFHVKFYFNGIFVNLLNSQKIIFKRNWINKRRPEYKINIISYFDGFPDYKKTFLFLF